jgi:hypothetical protein
MHPLHPVMEHWIQYIYNSPRLNVEPIELVVDKKRN